MPACKLFSSFALLLLPLAVRAQQPATLPITDAATGSPVPYASVGIQHKPIGRFAIQPLSAATPTDTVVVSCIGYEPWKLLASGLSRLAEVKLMPQAQALGEVKVRAAGWKRHRIGHEGSFSFTHYNFYMHTDADASPVARLGCEAGTVLRVPAGSFLEDAHVYIGWSHFRNVRFRLNVRALDKEGQPAASLLTRDVQFSIPDQARGWQHLDLKPYAVNVGTNTEVAVTLEWLQGTPDAARDWYNLTIPAPLTPLHRMVFRDKPEDRWHTYRANLSLYVTALSPRS